MIREFDKNIAPLHGSFPSMPVQERPVMVTMAENNTIASSNFWETGFNSSGRVFLVVMKGRLVLFVPDSLKTTLTHELACTIFAEVNFGKLNDEHYQGQNGFEIIFEDGSVNPFCFHFSHEQSKQICAAADGNYVLQMAFSDKQDIVFPAILSTTKALPTVEFN